MQLKAGSKLAPRPAQLVCMLIAIDTCPFMKCRNVFTFPAMLQSLCTQRGPWLHCCCSLIPSHSRQGEEQQQKEHLDSPVCACAKNSQKSEKLCYLVFFCIMAAFSDSDGTFFISLVIMHSPTAKRYTGWKPWRFFHGFQSVTMW